MRYVFSCCLLLMNSGGVNLRSLNYCKSLRKYFKTNKTDVSFSLLKWNHDMHNLASTSSPLWPIYSQFWISVKYLKLPILENFNVIKLWSCKHLSQDQKSKNGKLNFRIWHIIINFLHPILGKKMKVWLQFGLFFFSVN